MIGIIGANGDVGNLCYKLLSNYGIKNIKIGFRNNKPLNNSLRNSCYIDLLDKESCFKFVKNCDSIINCSYSDKKGIKNLLEAVEYYGGKLVDLTHYEDIELPEINKSLICHGVGVSPGLSEALPVIISQKFDYVTDLALYYVVCDKFSYSSAKSYLNYINGKNIYPMTEIKNRKLQVIDKQKIYPKFNMFAMNLNMISYMDFRTLQLSRKLGLKNASFSICMPEGETYRFLMSGKFRKAASENDIKKLIEASEKDTRNIDSNCCILLDIKGVLSNHILKKCMILKGDSSLEITSSVAVATAISLLNKNNTHGIFDMLSFGESNKILDIILSVNEHLYYEVIDDTSLSEIRVSEGEI